ncbi:integrase [Corynebacterium phage StAB]|uniref:Integrase n=1 Tax=Corynebacterium phage StAB TaxID=2591204 RepID=A0A514DJG5_9CAUD|nr:integrase [Corynebacterium phage StAB]QDH93737.1 tyrosine integrase [Corynebacterium phage StAB]
MSVQRRPKKGNPPGGGRPKWVVRYRDPTGKEHSETFTYDRYKTPEKAAYARDAEIKTALRMGTWTDPTHGQVLISTLATAWKDQADTTGTRKVRAYLSRNLGDLAATPVGQVNTVMVRAWLGQLRSGRPWVDGCEGLAASTRSSLMSQLKAMLNQAVADGMIPTNPAAPVQEPRPATKVTWEDVPTPEEVRLMIKTARDGGKKKRGADGKPTWVRKDPALAAAIVASAATGMRPGEVAGLDAAVIDVRRRSIAVIAQADEKGGGLRPLKTKEAGRRHLRVDQATLDVLSGLMGASTSGRLFVNHSGKPWSGHTYAYKFAHLRDYLGLRGALTPNSLRHFHATELMRAGVSPKTVQHRLGHTSSKLTHDVYSHFAPADDDVAADVFAGLMSGEGQVRDGGRHLRVV